MTSSNHSHSTTNSFCLFGTNKQKLIVNVMEWGLKKNKRMLWTERNRESNWVVVVMKRDCRPAAGTGAPTVIALHWRHFICQWLIGWLRYRYLFLALHYLIYCTDFLYFPECPSAAAGQEQQTCRRRSKRRSNVSGFESRTREGNTQRLAGTKYIYSVIVLCICSWRGFFLMTFHFYSQHC